MLFWGFHVSIALNLLKYILFVHTARMSCLSKICPVMDVFEIAQVNSAPYVHQNDVVHLMEKVHLMQAEHFYLYFS